MNLNARLIDPRDQTWEVDHPRYRVYFWDSSSAGEEWELDGCDVEGALRWAQDSAGGRPFTFYVALQSADERREVGLIRLLGTDPTQGSPETLDVEPPDGG